MLYSGSFSSENEACARGLMLGSLYVASKGWHAVFMARGEGREMQVRDIADEFCGNL